MSKFVAVDSRKEAFIAALIALFLWLLLPISIGMAVFSARKGQWSLAKKDLEVTARLIFAPFVFAWKALFGAK